MDSRIQIGDIIYIVTVDGSKIIGLDDPTEFTVNPDKDYQEAKQTIKLLRNMNVQNFTDRCLFKVCASKAKEGQLIKYGDKISLMMASSLDYLAQSSQPEFDMQFNKIEFRSYSQEQSQDSPQAFPKEFCWKFRPKLKHRKEGGYVYENDKISIETSANMGGFLKPMKTTKIASGFNEFIWKIKSFKDIGNENFQNIGMSREVPIRALDPVTLFSTESQKFLGVQIDSNVNSLTEYVEKSLNEQSYTLSLLETKQKYNKEFYFQTNGQNCQNIYKERQQEVQQQPFNGLFRLELEDPQSNAFLMQDASVRIRHVQSGKYLTLSRKEVTKKIIELEKEKQVELIQRAHLDSKVSSEDFEDDYEWQDFVEVTDIGVFGESEEEDEKNLEEIQNLNPEIRRQSQLLQSAKSGKFPQDLFIKSRTLRTFSHKVENKKTNLKSQLQQKDQNFNQEETEIESKQLNWIFILSKVPSNQNLFQVELLSESSKSNAIFNESTIALKIQFENSELQEQENFQKSNTEGMVYAYLGVENDKITLTEIISEKNCFQIQMNKDLLKSLWSYSPEYSLFREAAQTLSQKMEQSTDK